jgi:hypothetical protein
LLNYDGRSLESVPLDVLAECEQFLRIERGKQIGMALARAVGAECSIPPAPTQTSAGTCYGAIAITGANARPLVEIVGLIFDRIFRPTPGGRDFFAIFLDASLEQPAIALRGP